MAELFDSLPAGPVSRTFAQYLIAFCSRLEVASDVVSGRFVTPIVPDKCVKFGDSCLNFLENPKPLEVAFSKVFSQ